MIKPIVLASASPRRRELLEKTGLKFIVDAAEINEDHDRRIKPAELAKTISLEKAKAVAARHPRSIIIAADTFGVMDGRLLGKPRDEEEARDMLLRMSGRRHSVITGFSILDTENGESISEAVETRVYFRKLDKEEIEAYVKTGEPLDKAGAYAIQGLGALLVEKIGGDYYNVIGLPLSSLARGLKRFGVNLPGDLNAALPRIPRPASPLKKPPVN
ncbi:MAG: Maf family protein [Chloroflexi bacterium]|nr:Maf family protein [Chloroflexota bacterium]